MTNTAHAQAVSDSARKPFAAKIGVFIPNEEETRKASDKQVLSLEGDYTVQQLPELRSVSVVSLGFIEHARLRMVPLTIGQIYRDTDVASGRTVYFGGGLGVYFTRLRADGTSNTVKNIFGGYVVAGTDVTPQIFAEAKYHYISKYDNKYVGGLIISIGTRF